ncbi:MAG: Tm-1-like ATP-binding domain-containing protein, partial [Deltaproteobacteria bacterium]|nr:Tm-1-like ATP-binding domain-containing protein [Deltaproteobacteria bacterium]
GPAAVVFPLRGFSAIDREGFAFHEPETDRTFLEVLKREIKEGIEIVEVDAHLFDDDFIREVARVYDETARRGEHHG